MRAGVFYIFYKSFFWSILKFLLPQRGVFRAGRKSERGPCYTLSRRKTAAASTRKRCLFSHQAVLPVMDSGLVLAWAAMQDAVYGPERSEGWRRGLFLAEPPPPLKSEVAHYGDPSEPAVRATSSSCFCSIRDSFSVFTFQFAGSSRC